jgi:hypothetical protein
LGEGTLKVRFRFAGVEYECEGTSEEIASFRQQLEQGVVMISNSSTRPSNPNIPNHQKLKGYILSKPNFEHTMLEIAEHFLGRRISAWGETEGEYQILYNRLRRVHRAIEREYKGKFATTTFTDRNGNARTVHYKRWVFMKQ